MMSKISSKFQVTIPGELREKAKLDVGDRLVFLYTDNGEIIIRPIRKRRVKELGGALHQEGTEYIPLGEARRITQDELAKRLSGKEDTE